MWSTLDIAAVALTRDGWKRYTAYSWFKPVGEGRLIWLELEWDPTHTTLIPVQCEPDEDWDTLTLGKD